MTFVFVGRDTFSDDGGRERGRNVYVGRKDGQCRCSRSKVNSINFVNFTDCDGKEIESVFTSIMKIGLL